MNSGSLEIDGDPTNVGNSLDMVEILTLNGDGVATAGALNNVSGNNIYSGPITLASNASIGAVTSTQLTIQGLLQDRAPVPVPAARFRKAGEGTVVLPNTKTYGGVTVVDDGILNIRTPDALGIARSEQQIVQVVATSGTFRLSFRNQTTAPLPFNATALQVETALNAISTIGGVGGSVLVNVSFGSGINTYTIDFGGTLQNAQVPQIQAIYVAPSAITTVQQGTATLGEIQTVRVTATGGFFGLTFNGFTTTAIAVNASALTVETALNALASIGGVGGLVNVFIAGPLNDRTYTIVFAGTLGTGNLPQITSAVVGGTLVTTDTNLDGQGGTTVNSGGTLQLEGGMDFMFPTFGEIITLNGQGYNNIGALNVLNGNVNWIAPLPLLLGSNASIGVSNAGDTLTMFGPISDGGGRFDLDFYGPGTVHYRGDGNGSYNGTNYTIYTGTTTVHSGTMLLDVTGSNAIRGPLVVGDGIGGAFDAIVVELQGNEVADTSPVTVNSDGFFNLNGLTDTVADLTVNGGLVYTQIGGQLTTGDIDMTGGIIYVNDNGKLIQKKVPPLIPVNTVTMRANAQITAGANATISLGDVFMDDSTIFFFGSPATLTTGNVTMSNGSFISLPQGTFTSLDILMNGGFINLGDDSNLSARNVTSIGGFITLGKRDTFTATGAVSVSSSGIIQLDEDGVFAIAGNLTMADGTVKLADATVANKAKLTTAEISMTGASLIQIGNNGFLIASGKVTDMGGKITLGNSGLFTAGGNVSLTDGSVLFGTDGLFNNQPNDLALVNSQFTMGDNGTAKTRNVSLANTSDFTFGNVGVLDAAAGNLTMTGGSDLTFLNNGTATTKNVNIIGGTISFQDTGILAAANVTDNGGAISFGNTGLFTAGIVAVSGNGSIGFGTLAFPLDPYVTGGLNGTFTATGAVSFNDADFWMGDFGTATVQSLSLTTGSQVTFNDNGTLNDAGLLNLSGNSKLIFGDAGYAKAGDASQSNGLIAFLDTGKFEVTNFTNNGGAVSFKNQGIFRISPASAPVTVTNGSITFGNDGQFLDSGSLGLVQSSLILGNTGKVSTLAVTTSGASKIQMGNDGTIDTTSVTVATGGTIVLGNNDKFTAVGNVSVTGSNTPFGVIFGTDGIFKITGNVSLNNSELKLGTTGIVQVLGPTGDVTLSNAAKLNLAANGILSATGDLTMSGNSTADFGANGSASVNDLSISTGTFKMAAGTSPALHGFSASGTGSISGAAVTLGNNNHFTVVGDTKIEVSGANPASLTLGTGSTLGTGKLTVNSANVTVGANSTGTTLDMIVTGSSSKITFGDNDTLNTKNLTSTSGTFAFGINDKLLADGNVSFSGGAVNFSTAALGGAGGKLAATGDLTLDNTPLTFNVTGGIVTADDVFINNKAKITFANNGSLTAASTLNLDNGQMKFNTTGALTAGATTLRNSSIAGGSNITVTLGSFDSVTGSGAASSPAISLGSTSSLTVSGDVSLTNSVASTGGIILGNGNSFSAANVTLNTALLSLGNSGSFTTTGNLDLTVSQVQLGTSGSGSTQNIGLLSSSIGIGAATTLAVNGNITADSTFLGTSSIAGLGAINLGSLPHSAIIGNGDSVDNVDLAITTGINATAGALLNKTGVGRLQLASPTPSALGLNISAGDVQVDGVQTGPVQITSGTLSGKGSVGALTGSSGGPVVGTVAPGDNSQAIKSGILGSGSTVFGPQTVFSVDLSSSVPNNPIPGTDYDRLAVSGNIDLGNAVLDAHYGTGIRIGDSYTIITYTGTRTGKFQQFNSQDIAFVTGQKFTIDYSVTGSVILHKVRADATITMTSAPNPSTFNQTVTFTATIAPEPGSALIPNTTTVTFFIDGNPTPSVTVGATNQAVYTISTMSVGTHTLTATFNGDADNFNPASTLSSLTQTVEQPTVDPLVGVPSGTPAYISPINPSSVGVQDQLILSTTVRSERGTITWAIAIKNGGGGTVRTLIGNGNPGSGTTIPINAVWNGRDTGGTAVADGNYTATVTVTDSFTNVFSAAPIPVVVDNTSPTATINAPSPVVIDPTAASTLPSSTLLTGTVGDLNLSGWVLDIKNGNTLLREFSGTGTSVNVNWNGKYVIGNPTATPGASDPFAPDAAYTITITSLDLAGNQTTSSTQTVVVLANGPIVTLTTGAPNVYGTTFTLTATADLPAGSPASLYSLLAGDAVNFFQGATPLGTGNLVLNGSTGKYQTSITGPILNAGTYTNFKAVYPATADFPVGNSALASHTVTKAPLTITAIDKTRLYGAANPPFTFTTTGLVNNDTVAVLTGTLATTATPASNVGSYPITQGSLSPNGNYTITTFNNGTLSITPAPLTIKVNDATRPLNTPNPTFTFTVLGLVNGDLPSVVTSVPLGTTAVLNSPVGSYPITSTGTPTVSPNYTIVSIVPGSLSITPRLTSFSIGSGSGGIALVSLYNPDGSLIKTLTPFGSFFGGVRTVAADFNGDGVNDLAVGTGPGVIAQVSVFDGVSGANLFTSFPFETPGVPSFTGGLFVAAGDVDGDGVSELVITPDEGGGPRVIVQRGRTFAPMLSYLGINDPNFRGGARAGVGDLNGDGFADIAVSAGFDGGPRVSLWDGKSLANNQFRNLVSDFFVFSDSLRNGAYVGIGDVNGDGKGDLIAGAGPGGAPHVKIFSGASLLNPNIGPANTTPFASFFAGDSANRGGVRVAAKVLDSDLFVDVITGVGEKGGDTATAYLGVDLKAAQYIEHFTLDAFPGLNNNGVFVG